MKRLVYLLPALAMGFGLTACPGDDSPAVESSTETDADDDDGTTDTASTVTVSTTDPPTTTEPPTTTDPPTTTEPPTSSESGLPECTDQDECIEDTDCPLPGAVCVGCLCTGGAGCKEYGPGAFGDCANEGIESCMGSMGAGCFSDPPGAPVVSVCVSSCEETCDCPQPPKGFEAQLACEDIFTGDGNECIIGCETNDECPDGWSCFMGTFCAHGVPPELPGYGDCENMGGQCPPTMSGGAGGCLGVPEPMDGSSGEGGVCFAQPCEDADDCPAAPATGTAVVTCDNVTMDRMLDCFLDCSGGEICPDGMTCHAEAGLCYWEIAFLDPYGQCIDVPATCPTGPADEMEACLSTPDVSFCSNACADSDDCLAPLTGDAVPECTNIAMAMFCVLPCDDTTTCPDGMVCDADVGGLCTNLIP